jgi:hypothetical protein
MIPKEVSDIKAQIAMTTKEFDVWRRLSEAEGEM